jgi:hypothetical protein
MNTVTRRTLPTETKVLDEKLGLVEYTASSESIDSAREVIMQDGWDFSKFEKNAPFVSSHDYSSIENLIGKITDWRVEKKQLVLTAQWAKDIPGTLGEVGWKLTIGGFLKAVSVGFWPLQMVSRWDADLTGYKAALKKTGYTEQDNIAVVYQRQQLVELSSVILGANPDAVARAYKSGAITDADLNTISARLKSTEPKTAQEALNGAALCAQALRTRKAFSFAVNAAKASLAIQ